MNENHVARSMITITWTSWSRKQALPLTLGCPRVMLLFIDWFLFLAETDLFLVSRIEMFDSHST